eukprot:Anaeramoba_flamelloidesa601_143.p1 GENE.a601_143~~a601_143.p1  ORF type:complete len:377 (+),score=134.77 a601_143:68-1198(+)
MDFGITATSTPFDEKLEALTINITQTNEGKKEFKSKRYIYFLLDTSGSMSGVNLRRAKEAILKLLLSIWSKKNIQPVLITYNSKAELIQLPTDIMIAQQVVNSIKAGGSTNFRAAFKLLTIQIMKQPETISDLFVLFFTDGQDNHDKTENKQRIHKMINNFKHSLTLKTATSTVCSLGFTSDHDAGLMGKIATLGTNRGNFKYVKNSEDIGPTVEVFLEYILAADSVSARLLLNGEFHDKIFLQKKSQEVKDEEEKEEKTKEINEIDEMQKQLEEMQRKLELKKKKIESGKKENEEEEEEEQSEEGIEEEMDQQYYEEDDEFPNEQTKKKKQDYGVPYILDFSYQADPDLNLRSLNLMNENESSDHEYQSQSSDQD